MHGSIVAMEIFDTFSGRILGISRAQHVLIKCPELVHTHTNALFQYGMKFLSLCDITGVKHPIPLRLSKATIQSQSLLRSTIRSYASTHGVPF